MESMEAMEAAAKEAEVPDDAERRLPSPPSTPGSEASEEIPMHAAWWAEERPDLFLPVPPCSRELSRYHAAHAACVGRLLPWMGSFLRRGRHGVLEALTLKQAVDMLPEGAMRAAAAHLLERMAWSNRPLRR